MLIPLIAHLYQETTTMKKQPLTKFDPTACKILRASLDEALAAVAEAHGVSIQIGRMSYRADSVTVKVEVAPLGEMGRWYGETVTREARDFLAYARTWGLKPEELGKQFRNRGQVYRVTGLKPRSSKRPIVVEEVVSGKSYVFPEDIVRWGLDHDAVETESAA